MPKFAANLSMMFNEHPFLERFAHAAEAGFRGVEFLFPYEHAPSEVAARLRGMGLENALFNLPPGDFSAGERGLAAVPGREKEFEASVEKALEYALALGTRRLHAMAGLIPASGDRERYRETYVRNLRFAAEKLSPHGITLLIEAINTRDIPGYFLNTQAESDSVCESVGAANIRMQMDCYHMQIVEGDLATKLQKYAARCGHIQIAGVPGRHEPDNGEINYPYIFGLLDEIGYEGWVGCEYRPAEGTVEGLGWFREWKSF
jgi:hydroxypyruvate isomerase